MNMWFDVAVAASLFAIGNIFFGHFEERTAKWRRVLKLLIITSLAGTVGATAGHVWSAAALVSLAALGGTVHFVYLRKHGIDPWTAEPRDKYYALRGWRR